MTRGQYLIKLRIKAKLSQNSVANELGYSPQLISLWEKDKATPDISVIGKYASILNVDLKSFIECKDKKKNNHCDEMNFDISKFSSNLKLLRKEKNLLQSDVATKLNINIKSIGSWENGSSTPSIDNFLTLCKLFDKSVDELYFVFTDENKTDEDESSKKKNKFILPIIIPLVVLTAGGTATGIGIGVSRSRKNSNNTQNIEESCEHVFDKTTIDATYEADGKETYVCSLCGYSYEEILPKLEHHYSDTYSFDNECHYHYCIDDGYEDLVDSYTEHHFSSNVTNPTFDNDGHATYTCVDCGYSHEEVLPKLIHRYSNEWSGDRAYHYHSCIDEGYEDLFADKGEHDYSSVTDGEGITTYTCQTCGFEYDTSDYITVLDMYSAENERLYSVSAQNGFYIKVLNASHYPLSVIGYEVIEISHNTLFQGSTGDFTVLDSPNYTFFYFDLLKHFPGLQVPGLTLSLKFTEIYLDPNLHGVNCEEFIFTVVE